MSTTDPEDNVLSRNNSYLEDLEESPENENWWSDLASAVAELESCHLNEAPPTDSKTAEVTNNFFSHIS